MSHSSKFLHDLGVIADDALHTAVSEIEGPFNQIMKDAKDAYNIAKDTFTTPDTKTSSSASHTAPRSDVKRKFAGDPTSAKRLKFMPSRSVNTGQHGMQTANTVDEVPVMPAGRTSKSHPEYFTVDLPFYSNFTLNLGTGETIDEQYIRLDSPYDPIVDGNFSESRQPLGRDTWAGIYDYYRVLEADVTMKFTYTYGSFGDDQVDSPRDWNASSPIHAMVGYHVTDDATDKASNPIAFVEMKHSKATYIHPTNFAVHSNTAASGTNDSRIQKLHCNGGTQVLGFHYQPEQWDYHVTNLGLQERWTPKDATPDFTHLLGLVVAYPNNNTALLSNEVIKIHVDLYVKYKTQWREVNSTKKRSIDSS